MTDSWKPPVARLTQWVQNATAHALTNDTAQDAAPERASNWSYQHVREPSPGDDSRAALLQDEDNDNKSGTDSARGSIDEDPMADDPFEWSEQEEKALVRKLDFIVMPMLILGFFALQLDRGNIGNALTDFFLRDVEITQFQFNVGQQLMSLGIVLLEIPSNLMLYRIGPSLWIGCQVLGWGMVAALQSFQKGLAAFLITRFLLGSCEAGFIPAGLYTITRWYTRNETSKRFSWFFLGNELAAALTGLISYGILHMRGVLGIAGWQWLFLIEGTFTIIVGAIFLSLFPKSTETPVSLLGVSYFTERETNILTKRVIRDDPTKVHVRSHVSRSELMNALTNWRLIPHVLLTICGLAPTSTMAAYAPSLVGSFGYDRLASNAMVSIGAWMVIGTTIIWGSVADKTRLRGPMVLLGLIIVWFTNLGNLLLIHSNSATSRFLCLTLAIGFAQQWHPVNGSWMSLNAQSSGERSVTLAIFIMSANVAGIIGSQLFQADDAPLYRNGWSAILFLVTIGLIASAVANVQYVMLNRRNKHIKDQPVYNY